MEQLYPFRIAVVNGRIVPEFPGQCEPHTPGEPETEPFDDWLEWADRMSRTRDQRQCRGCGLWAVWEPRSLAPVPS